MTTTSIPEIMSRFSTATITIGDNRLGVWVADDGGERRQGLMGVEELPEGIEGMIFVFPAPGRTSFHMKDTLIPLDIWWFDTEMRLIGTAEMEPCPGEPCTSYASPGSVQWVLETPQGARGFQPGDQLSIVESG